MPEFEWLDSFELGVPEIDSDHKKLFALAKYIRPAVLDANHAKCLSAVEEFITLTLEHFQREEAILRDLGYPELKVHIKYHTSLMDSARKMKEVCQNLKSQHEMEECYRAMTAFLIDDFIRGDFTFKSFLQEKGFYKNEPGHPMPSKRNQDKN